MSASSPSTNFGDSLRGVEFVPSTASAKPLGSHRPSGTPSHALPEVLVRPVTGAQRRTHRSGFTLVELLVVMAVILLLLGVIVPALGPLKGSQDVTTAAYNLAGVLETARNYAIANDTYTWVGFYEQDYSSTASGNTAPPTGIGHLTVCTVYSKDGTKLCDDPAPGAASTSQPLPAASLGQVDKLVQIYAVHLKGLNAPTSPNSSDPTVSLTLPGRPFQTDLSDTDLKETRINSDTPDTYRPFTVRGYTFYKTIRFNPRGEANVNSTLPCTRIIEIGLQPTHGNVADNNTPNLVAIQQTGIGGAVNIYRP